MGAEAVAHVIVVAVACRICRPFKKRGIKCADNSKYAQLQEKAGEFQSQLRNNVDCEAHSVANRHDSPCPKANIFQLYEEKEVSVVGLAELSADSLASADMVHYVLFVDDDGKSSAVRAGCMCLPTVCRQQAVDGR